MKARQYNTQRQTSARALYFNIGLTISLLFVITAFEWKFEEGPEPGWTTEIPWEEDVFLPPITHHEIPEPPKPMKTARVLDQAVETKDAPSATDHALPVLPPEMLPNNNIFPDGLLAGGPQAEDASIDFMVVERQPEPIGGMSAFYEHIRKNLNYPRMALKAGVGGVVEVEFTVNVDGRLTDFKVVKGLGFGLDEEAIRVLSNAPRWNPGKQRGVPVKVRMRAPINFAIRRS